MTLGFSYCTKWHLATVALCRVACIAQIHHAFAALQDLTFQLVDLAGQVLGDFITADGTAGVDDDEQQNDGPQTTADAVDEGQTEDIKRAAFHRFPDR